MAVESYVIGLFHLYPTVYFHKATRGAEKLFTELLAKAVKLARTGKARRTGLASSHPLLRFARKPDLTESVLCLDDTVIWASLHEMVDAQDRLIQDFATRLRDRKLYKCKDVREIVTQRFGLNRHEKVDKACAQIALSIKNWRHNDDKGIPRVLIDDEVERALYKPGPVNQIFVQQVERGDPINIAKVSAAVRATLPFRASRLYYREEDVEALKFVDKLIRRETDHGKRR
jgi:HD superfamily phosphohydrolase